MSQEWLENSFWSCFLDLSYPYEAMSLFALAVIPFVWSQDDHEHNSQFQCYLCTFLGHAGAQ
uniref:Uncharacterized protein n=1 Tax=Arundo donax TaxID=35708 RepID=A0A0A8XXH3_ARUDO